MVLIGIHSFGAAAGSFRTGCTLPHSIPLQDRTGPNTKYQIPGQIPSVKICLNQTPNLLKLCNYGQTSGQLFRLGQKLVNDFQLGQQSTTWLLFLFFGMAFVSFRRQGHGFCIFPASTTWFFLFRHQQHGCQTDNSWKG